MSTLKLGTEVRADLSHKNPAWTWTGKITKISFMYSFEDEDIYEYTVSGGPMIVADFPVLCYEQELTPI